MRRELAYAQLASNFSTTSAEADVPSLTVIATVGARPILVVLWAQQQGNSAANQFAQAHIKEGAAIIADGGLLQSVNANQVFSCIVMRRLNPTPGDHTYKATFGRSAFSGSGTATLSGSAQTPMFLQVYEI